MTPDTILQSRIGRYLGILAFSVCIFVGVGCLPISTSIKDGREGLVVELWASNKCPKLGEIVTLRATVSNQRTRSVLIALSDQPVLDIIVGNPDSSVNRWSTGKTLTSDLTQLELEPGKSKSIQMDWHIEESSTVVSANFFEGPDLVLQPIRPLMVLNIDGCAIFGP